MGLRMRLNELYPKENWSEVVDTNRVVDGLCKHYEDSADIQVTSEAPPVYWGRAAELHAASGLMREPIYVIDVDVRDQIRARRYYFRDVTGNDEITREMGCDFNMTAEELNEFLSVCLKNQVLLIILLYRRRQGGDHFQRLRFEETLYQSFLHDESVDTHPNMRERLDEVHRILSIPVVDFESTWEFSSPEGHEQAQDGSSQMSTPLSQSSQEVLNRVMKRDENLD